MKQYSLFIPGNPQGQARPRTVSKGGSCWTYSPKSEWTDTVYSVGIKNRPKNKMCGPVSLDLKFYFRRPKYIGLDVLYHTKRPDLDNIEKGTIDALTKAKWWVDDSLICCKNSVKIYAEHTKGEEPGCFIVVRNEIQSEEEKVNEQSARACRGCVCCKD